MPQPRHLRPRFEHLVDLLLILDDGIGDFGVIQDVDEFGRRRVLVHRHGNPAQRLRGDHRPVQPGTVVADDREVHAAPETLRRQPAGERAHFVGDLRPAPGLPDAEILLAGRRRVAALERVFLQQARESRAA
jgi:hypothetical protein